MLLITGCSAFHCSNSASLIFSSKYCGSTWAEPELWENSCFTLQTTEQGSMSSKAFRNIHFSTVWSPSLLIR
ncbi:MAG: hypothetical protein P8Y66_05015 [Nitrospirota bacterium]